MKAGDKVVCVDFSNNEICDRPPNLLPNVTYVLSAVYDYFGATGVNLIGVKPPHPNAVGFKASRFRLLDELKQEARARQIETKTEKLYA